MHICLLKRNPNYRRAKREYSQQIRRAFQLGFLPLNVWICIDRGEPITVFFVTNAIYGMTGGQVAPTTPMGEKTIMSPFGRSPWNEGYPLHVSDVLASLEAPVYKL